MDIRDQLEHALTWLHDSADVKNAGDCMAQIVLATLIAEAAAAAGLPGLSDTAATVALAAELSIGEAE